jgi:hypothetical protein
VTEAVARRRQHAVEVCSEAHGSSGRGRGAK